MLYKNIASELPTCFYEITKVLLSRWLAAVFSKSRSTVTSVLAIFDDRFHRVHSHCDKYYTCVYNQGDEERNRSNTSCFKHSDAKKGLNCTL